VANRCAQYLKERGRKNVSIAYNYGSPLAEEVIERMMGSEGVDTFCILPLTVAEGNLTLWVMPKQFTEPGDAKSWTVVGEHDAEIRSSTTKKDREKMADAIVRNIGKPKKGVGVVVLARGSKEAQSEMVAGYYAERIGSAGWPCRTAFSRHGPRNVTEAVSELKEEGCSEILLVPLFICTAGKSCKEALEDLKKTGVKHTVSGALASYPEFMEILDSRVPENW